MLPILHIGPLAIQLPGLLLLLGLWLGLSLAEKHAPSRGVRANQIYSLTGLAIVAGLLGARLAYIIRYFSIFTQTPASAFSLNPELLDPTGALLGVGFVGWMFIHRNKLNPWSLLDTLAPTLAVLAIAIALSNLSSGKGFGAPTQMPWAIFLWGQWRHPTQIYELIAAGISLGIFWPSRQHFQRAIPGIYGLSLLAVTAGWRLFLEAFRADSVTVTGGFRLAQLTAWVILALSLWIITQRSGHLTSSE